MSNTLFNASDILNRLTKSMDDLEEAIEKTAIAVSEAGMDPLESRLDGYRQACKRQRELIEELKGKISREDFDAILPIVNKINGISAMIRDDAINIVHGQDTIDDRDLN